MILANATWTEVEALDREQVVVIPVGGMQQHGPHLPIGTATVLCEMLVQGLESQVGSEVIVVPTIAYAVSGADKAFAGTVDLGHNALQSTIFAVVAAFLRHRFRRFVVVTGLNGDTNASIRLTLRALKDAHPQIQFARIHTGASALSRGEVLMATAPDLVRDPELIERTRQPLAPAVYDCFITDADETSPEGFRMTRHEDMLANGQDYMPRQIASAIELVRVMREGRIYVEEAVV